MTEIVNYIKDIDYFGNKYGFKIILEDNFISIVSFQDGKNCSDADTDDRKYYKDQKTYVNIPYDTFVAQAKSNYNIVKKSKLPNKDAKDFYFIGPSTIKLYTLFLEWYNNNNDSYQKSQKHIQIKNPDIEELLNKNNKISLKIWNIIGDSQKKEILSAIIRCDYDISILPF